MKIGCKRVVDWFGVWGDGRIGEEEWEGERGGGFEKGWILKIYF